MLSSLKAEMLSKGILGAALVLCVTAVIFGTTTSAPVSEAELDSTAGEMDDSYTELLRKKQEKKKEAVKDIQITAADCAAARKIDPKQDNGLGDGEGDQMNPSKGNMQNEEEKVVSVGGAPRTRNANKWPGGVLYYGITDSGWTTAERRDILAAMFVIEGLTCIRFVQRTTINKGNSVSFVRQTDDDPHKGCNSLIGMHGDGPQVINLVARGSKHGNCFKGPGNAEHEILHALGFIHEHERLNRDEWVKIIQENINPNKYADFKLTKGQLANYAVDREHGYDYGSIMHYPTYADAKRKGETTIKPLKFYNATKIGQRITLSPIDVKRLKAFYDCKNITPAKPVCGPKA